MRCLGAALAAAAMLASCAPRPAPPAPAPPPPITATPPPSAPAPPPPDWRDAPLSPGDWSYRPDGAGSMAVFETPGGSAAFAIQCDPGGRLTLILPAAASSAAITIRTSFGERTLASSGRESRATAALPPSDPLLDQIAFSRGRFLVRAEGTADLILPSWPEPARAIEECRA